MRSNVLCDEVPYIQSIANDNNPQHLCTPLIDYLKRSRSSGSLIFESFKTRRESTPKGSGHMHLEEMFLVPSQDRCGKSYLRRFVTDGISHKME